MTASLTRLHLATRMHFGLLRLLGEGLDVARMLRDRDYADEAINICRSLDDFALLELAERFGEANAVEDVKVHLAAAARSAREALAMIPRRGPSVPQEMTWSQQTSGFGLMGALSALQSSPASRPGERTVHH